MNKKNTTRPSVKLLRNKHIGRRTGIDVKEGKNIRKFKDGYENFDDYWTESEADSICDISVRRNPVRIKENSNVVCDAAGGRENLTSHAIGQTASLVSKSKNNAFQKKKNIGRRTGQDMKQGKNIRKFKDGYENFDDYWTESEVDSICDISEGRNKENSNVVCNIAAGGDNSTCHSISQSVSIVSRTKNNTFQKKHIGRRTGKDVKSGKDIRRFEDGFENFDDYWSASEADSIMSSFCVTKTGSDLIPQISHPDQTESESADHSENTEETESRATDKEQCDDDDEDKIPTVSRKRDDESGLSTIQSGPEDVISTINNQVSVAEGCSTSDSNKNVCSSSCSPEPDVSDDVVHTKEKITDVSRVRKEHKATDVSSTGSEQEVTHATGPTRGKEETTSASGLTSEQEEDSSAPGTASEQEGVTYASGPASEQEGVTYASGPASEQEGVTYASGPASEQEAPYTAKTASDEKKGADNSNIQYKQGHEKVSSSCEGDEDTEDGSVNSLDNQKNKNKTNVSVNKSGQECFLSLRHEPANSDTNTSKNKHVQVDTETVPSSGDDSEHSGHPESEDVVRECHSETRSSHVPPQPEQNTDSETSQIKHLSQTLETSGIKNKTLQSSNSGRMLTRSFLNKSVQSNSVNSVEKNTAQKEKALNSSHSIKDLNKSHQDHEVSSYNKTSMSVQKSSKIKKTSELSQVSSHQSGVSVIKKGSLKNLQIKSSRETIDDEEGNDLTGNSLKKNKNNEVTNKEMSGKKGTNKTAEEKLPALTKTTKEKSAKKDNKSDTNQKVQTNNNEHVVKNLLSEKRGTENKKAGGVSRKSTICSVPEFLINDTESDVTIGRSKIGRKSVRKQTDNNRKSSQQKETETEKSSNNGSVFLINDTESDVTKGKSKTGRKSVRKQTDNNRKSSQQKENDSERGSVSVNEAVRKRSKSSASVVNVNITTGNISKKSTSASVQGVNDESEGEGVNVAEAAGAADTGNEADADRLVSDTATFKSDSPVSKLHIGGDVTGSITKPEDPISHLTDPTPMLSFKTRKRLSYSLVHDTSLQKKKKKYENKKTLQNKNKLSDFLNSSEAECNEFVCLSQKSANSSHVPISEEDDIDDFSLTDSDIVVVKKTKICKSNKSKQRKKRSNSLSDKTKNKIKSQNQDDETNVKRKNSKSGSEIVEVRPKGNVKNKKSPESETSSVEKSKKKNKTSKNKSKKMKNKELAENEEDETKTKNATTDDDDEQDSDIRFSSGDKHCKDSSSSGSNQRHSVSAVTGKKSKKVTKKKDDKQDSCSETEKSSKNDICADVTSPPSTGKIAKPQKRKRRYSKSEKNVTPGLEKTGEIRNRSDQLSKSPLDYSVSGDVQKIDTAHKSTRGEALKQKSKHTNKKSQKKKNIRKQKDARPSFLDSPNYPEACQLPERSIHDSIRQAMTMPLKMPQSGISDRHISQTTLPNSSKTKEKQSVKKTLPHRRLTSCLVQEGSVMSTEKRNRRVTINKTLENFSPPTDNVSSNSAPEKDDSCTESIVHFAEVTTSATPQSIKEPKKAKIIFPKSPPQGLRRSKRTRVQTLEWYKNERVIYDRRKSGCVVMGIQPSLEQKYLQKQKVRRLKRPKGLRRLSKGRLLHPVNLSVHVNLPDDLDLTCGPEVPVISADSQKETMLRCFAKNENFETVFPNDDDDDDGKENPAFQISHAILQSLVNSGNMILFPLAEKPPQIVASKMLCFCVIYGKISVTIHRGTCIVETGNHFFVPKGNPYSLKNLRNEEARLAFFSFNDLSD